MTIMSYAMSAYQSMNYLAKADVGWAKDLKSNFSGFITGMENQYNTAVGYDWTG